ncbi:sulfurtransferase [Endozoicomonas numazuensis]|uniref:Thiosulfate sulfurtransferase n=1 Tax=Endozoicomonas numazuensis TaxID=1137799 RepID=A0A081NII5_9GAMM|nr:rhodanese-like domain-containing protein [Endozoicomonas numazuensis]KEQ18258.1 thiosulfate sulfurtransferase [Endozoicomonas numazuensis]
MNPIEDLPLILEADQLVPLLGHEELLIVDLCNPRLYSQTHVPGAVNVAPQSMVSGIQPAAGKLPSVEQLEQMLSNIGYSENKHIVVYDDEGGGWAGRFIWTLDVIGHKKCSYLNGGAHVLLKEKKPTESTINHPEPTQVNIQIDDSFIASKDFIIDSLKDSDTVIWDARSAAEYHGEKVFSQRGGHIPGAVNLEWTLAMDHDRNLRIRSDIANVLEQLGITQNKNVITHCQSHHRSGFTYLVGKSLGLSIKAYDGSWSEWGNLPDTPIES